MKSLKWNIVVTIVNGCLMILEIFSAKSIDEL